MVTLEYKDFGGSSNKLKYSYVDHTHLNLHFTFDTAILYVSPYEDTPACSAEMSPVDTVTR